VEWLKDASAGRWIVQSTSGEFGATVPNLLPQGFEAYVRVFHPMTRSTPGPGTLPNLPAVVRVLADHTTASTGVAAIWEGWGGLVSSQGRLTMKLSARSGSFDGPLARAASATRAAYQRVRSHFAYREAPPGSGVLPADVATGPKLELPGRAYFLAHLDLADLSADDWEQRAIWADPPFVHTPSLLWPDDHAWCLATEVDLDSTLIGGSRALAAALIAAPGLEVLEIDRHAGLRYADTL